MQKQISFDDRIDRLKKDLQRTADRHANLLGHLRPKVPEAWTDKQLEAPGNYAIADTDRALFVERSTPDLDY